MPTLFLDTYPEITGPMMVAEVRRIVAESPERVYKRVECSGTACSYIDSADRPGTGCGIGVALIALGVHPQVLADAEDAPGRHYPDDVNGTTIRDMKVWLGLSSEEPFLSWLQGFQSAQDSGCAWSDCVITADRQTPLPDVG